MATALLKKEKSHTTPKIACLVQAWDTHFKAPIIMNTVTFIILGLASLTEDTNIVINSINIFMFPDLSIVAESEAAMITSSWDTTLESNTLMSYANKAVIIMKQHIASIVGWGVSAKMIG